MHGAEPLPYPETGREPDSASPPSTPRWVKVSGIIAIVLVLLFVGMHLTGHVPTHTPPASGVEHGMQTP